MGATYTRLTGLSNSDVLTFALCYKLEIQDKIHHFSSTDDLFSKNCNERGGWGNMKPRTIYLLISFLFKVDWYSFPSISVLCPPSTLSIYIIPKYIFLLNPILNLESSKTKRYCSYLFFVYSVETKTLWILLFLPASAIFLSSILTIQNLMSTSDSNSVFFNGITILTSASQIIPLTLMH